MRERKTTCGWCFNIWKQKKDPSTCYRIASPDNPVENFNPGVSGFTPTPRNESEFEQNFDLICNELIQVTNKLVKTSFNTRVLQQAPAPRAAGRPPPRRRAVWTRASPSRLFLPPRASYSFTTRTRPSKSPWAHVSDENVVKDDMRIRFHPYLILISRWTLRTVHRHQLQIKAATRFLAAVFVVHQYNTVAR